MATLAQILISKLPLAPEQMHQLQSEVHRQEAITAASLSQVIKMINNGKDSDKAAEKSKISGNS